MLQHLADKLLPSMAMIANAMPSEPTSPGSRGPRALLMEEDQCLLQTLANMTQRRGFTTVVAGTFDQARDLLRRNHIDLAVIDLAVHSGRGAELLADVSPSHRPQIILMGDNGHAPSASAGDGVVTLSKPLDLPRLHDLLDSAYRSCRPDAHSADFDGFGTMVGRCPAMTRIYDVILKVAPTDATVLIVGESGTGKELIAQAIHDHSPRREQAFIPVNCGAIPENLIDSELFGHEKGAFTGATRSHDGFFERSDGGTLFLDEITEMLPDLQIRLLRVLETGRSRRVGGSKDILVNCRVITATNRPPLQAVEEGSLRSDLFYRLSVFPIHVPPLRQREGDIQLLAHHFVRDLNEQSGQQKTLSDEAIAAIQHFDWPGNVRQLKNVLHQAYILAEDSVIGPQTLPATVSGRMRSDDGGALNFKVGVSIAEVERELICATLQQFSGDKRKTAEVLGVSLRTLYNRLGAYRDTIAPADP